MVSDLDLTGHPETLVMAGAHPFFYGITDDEIKCALPFFKLVTLGPREVFIEEGLDSSRDLYLILIGDLEVIKKSRDKDDHVISEEIDKQFVIARLTGGDAIGELSFIKGDARSASIRSVTASLLLSLSPHEFGKLELRFTRIASRMMKNMVGYVGDRLNKTSTNEVKALKVELQNSILNSKANLFFSYVIGLLCFYNLTIHTISTLSVDANRASAISAIIIVIFSGVLVLMIRQSKLPWHIFGLTTRNWKKALKESLIWSAFVIGLMVAIKWILIHQVERYHHLPLFDFNLNSKQYMAFNFILYGLHSPVQEFIARGVLQGSLQHFFKGRNVTLRSVIISNALFSATHVHLMNGLLGLIVFVPGLFWGWLYARHRNLIGVSVSHILIGWSALFFLNVESLF